MIIENILFFVLIILLLSYVILSVYKLYLTIQIKNCDKEIRKYNNRKRKANIK